MRRRALVRGLAALPLAPPLLWMFGGARAANATPRLVAGGLGFTNGLYQDRDHLYWWEKRAIRRVAKRGGRPTEIATGTMGILALGDDRLVLEERSAPDRGIVTTTAKTMPARGGPATPLVSSPHTIRVATTDATGFYFFEVTEKVSLLHVPWSGGKPRQVAEASGDPAILVADATHLYWTAISGVVHSVPKTGGAPATLGRGETAAGYLAVDDRWVFWTEDGGSALYRAPKRGGEPTKLATGTPDEDGVEDELEMLALHDRFVYFIESDVSADRASLRRAPKSGGHAQTMARRTSCQIVDLVVDGTAAFWIERAEKRGGGETFRIVGLPL